MCHVLGADETDGTGAGRVNTRLWLVSLLLPAIEEWRMAEPTNAVDLSMALEALRQELEDAWTKGRTERVRFRVSDVTLTVQTIARRENKVGGKLRWWVIEGGGDHTAAKETTQTLVLTLTPNLYDDAGQSGPLDVGGDQPTPGR